MKLNISFDELGLPVGFDGDNTQSCGDVGKYFTLLHINKKILDEQLLKTNPPRPRGEFEEFEEYDDYVNARNSTYNEILVNKGLGAVVDSDIAFIDKLNTLKPIKGVLRVHPSISGTPDIEQMRSIMTGLALYDFKEEIDSAYDQLTLKQRLSVSMLSVSSYRIYKKFNLLADTKTLLDTVVFLTKAAIFKTKTDDTQLLMKYIVAKNKNPTFISKFTSKLFFKYRPRSVGDDYRVGMQNGLTFAWYKAKNRCNVTSAVSWEYRPPWLGGNRGDGWMGLWEPVINWLKE